MTTRTVKLWGPPGTGKTTVLVGKFVALAHVLGGPDRVAAVTYTRAAAEELRVRLAGELGLRGTPDDFRRQLPWVGTVHSLAWRLQGKPKLWDTKSGDEADASQTSWRGDDDDLIGEREVARSVWSLARNRCQAPADAYQDVALYATPRQAAIFPTLGRVMDLIQEYEAEKKSRSLLDFEDVLIAASDSAPATSRHAPQIPPVRALLVDEAQDNSDLMWRVARRWAQGADLAIYAGDPWQAIYRHAGADPALFLREPGEWVTLTRSHRLGMHDALYAQALLLQGGWRDFVRDDPSQAGIRITAWHGMGGYVKDGTVAHLARTHLILRAVEKSLRAEAVPYGALGSGKAPLEQSSGRAARLLARLEGGATVPTRTLASTLRAGLDRRMAAQAHTLDALVGDDDEVSGDEFSRATGRALREWLYYLTWGDYFRDVWDRHGPQALVAPSKTFVSTIHGAKGREFDVVHLDECWGGLPLAALASSDEGARAEACVAYVGATRHRVALHLTLHDGASYGGPYPFPSLDRVVVAAGASP